MTEKIIIAGAGGQGIMLLGKILAFSAMRENKFTTWLPAYGAEVRGGTAHCMVIVSAQEIGSPYIGQADTLIIMNQPSLVRFQPKLKKNGKLFVNSSLVKGRLENSLEIFKYPFTDIAEDLGNIRIANMVALGCYLGQSDNIKIKTVLNTINEIAPPDKKILVEINQEAVLKGANLVKCQVPSLGGIK